jgi:hypothetical protein
VEDRNVALVPDGSGPVIIQSLISSQPVNQLSGTLTIRNITLIAQNNGIYAIRMAGSVNISRYTMTDLYVDGCVLQASRQGVNVNNDGSSPCRF